ncbi:MAG: hypothetical protein Fur0020_08420 [Thermodesulfovibrionia bacterium]
MNPKRIKIASLLIILFIMVMFILNKEIIIHIPVFGYGEYLKVNSEYISVGRWSVPFVYDWDSDGKKDLLIGYRDGEHGYVAFFKNAGSNNNPSLTGKGLLTAGGKYIDLPPDG